MSSNIPHQITIDNTFLQWIKLTEIYYNDDTLMAIENKYNFGTVEDFKYYNVVSRHTRKVRFNNITLLNIETFRLIHIKPTSGKNNAITCWYQYT